MVVLVCQVVVRKSVVSGPDCPVGQLQAPSSSPPESLCSQTLPFSWYQETGEHQSVKHVYMREKWKLKVVPRPSAQQYYFRS